MENASKALIIAGAILLSILIIAIGIYIFNNAQSTIENSMTSMSTQEKEAFNSMFTIYEGKQSGSNVKALVKRLIANANTYKEEPQKCPSVNVPDEEDEGGISGGYNWATYPSNGYDETDLKNYLECLSEMFAWPEKKHTYTVTVSYNTAGLVDKIYIKY